MLENPNNPENKFIRYQYAESRLEPIWDSLVSILKDPENVIPRLEEYTFKNSSAEKAKKGVTQCEKQLDILKEQRSRISTVFVYKGIPEKEYKKSLSECNSKIEEVESQKFKFEQMLVKREESKDRNKIIQDLYEKIKTRLDNLSYEDKQYILKLFVERINLFHKRNYAEVFFRFPCSTHIDEDKHTKNVSQENTKLVLSIKTLSLYNSKK